MVLIFLFEYELNELNEYMENPLKDCLTIQVSEVDVNSPDFDLSNYMNKKIKEKWFKKALEFEQTLEVPLHS